MKKLQLFLVMATIGGAVLVGCKKTTTTPTNTTTTTTACNGKTICFKLDGTDISDDVKFRKIAANGSTPARNRIETASGSIEIDIYADAVGTYNVVDKQAYAANDAAFQYYVQGSKNMEGVSGTVEITAISATAISGKFTLKAEDRQNGDKVADITVGNFVNVPLK